MRERQSQWLHAASVQATVHRCALQAMWASPDTSAVRLTCGSIVRRWYCKKCSRSSITGCASEPQPMQVESGLPSQ